MAKFLPYPVCVFLMLQLTALVSMVDVEYKVVKIRRGRKPQAQMFWSFDAHELLFSPLYSLAAMSLFYYGYGLVYLRHEGPYKNLLLCLCNASVDMWRKFWPVMLLPWLMTVLPGVLPYPNRLWHCLAMDTSRMDFCFIHVVACISFWIVSMMVVFLTFSFTVLSNLCLHRSTRIDRYVSPELRAYIRGINESYGFQLITIHPSISYISLWSFYHVAQ
ncbi:uncharacterized protein [Drosophila pseudoobscura]|uniref:Uncharacterized protein isoform X1 n=2 Tax=Drosophila pseudoobscura pseudoobscura TaxID=46245 RepID=A0A6I8UXP1_DROPS|nr:uncharacterized protein LOC6903028 isoform X1 [Drosophila pseudoobscura]